MISKTILRFIVTVKNDIHGASDVVRMTRITIFLKAPYKVIQHLICSCPKKKVVDTDVHCFFIFAIQPPQSPYRPLSFLSISIAGRGRTAFSTRLTAFFV